MESLRYELMRAVVEAMHFDTPESESSPGEFMDVIDEIDRNDENYAMKRAGEDAVDHILNVLESYGFIIPEIARERKYVDPYTLNEEDADEEE